MPWANTVIVPCEIAGGPVMRAGLWWETGIRLRWHSAATIKPMKALIKGAILGAGFYAIGALAFLVPVLLTAGKVGTRPPGVLSMLPAVLLPLLLSVGSGAALGWAAGQIQEKRRLRLLLLTVLVFWLDALSISGLLMFSEAGYPGGFWAQLTGMLMASMAGLLLYGIVLLPILAGAALTLEWWTRVDLETP